MQILFNQKYFKIKLNSKSTYKKTFTKNPSVSYMKWNIYKYKLTSILIYSKTKKELRDLDELWDDYNNQWDPITKTLKNILRKCFCFIIRETDSKLSFKIIPFFPT